MLHHSRSPGFIASLNPPPAKPLGCALLEKDFGTIRISNCVDPYSSYLPSSTINPSIPSHNEPPPHWEYPVLRQLCLLPSPSMHPRRRAPSGTPLRSKTVQTRCARGSLVLSPQRSAMFPSCRPTRGGGPGRAPPPARRPRATALESINGTLRTIFPSVFV